MKPSKVQYLSIRHRATLSQTILTEAWLHNMSQRGYSLEEVSGSIYKFSKSVPQEDVFFIMTPEAGTNSDSWVFYEFEQHMGTRIPCSGNSFLSPSHVLRVKKASLDSQEALISYYYQYRNYRLLKRFRRNTILSVFLFLGGFFVSIMGGVDDLVVLLPYLFAGGILSFYFGYSYVTFRKMCISLGFTKPADKPKRPGY